jgi:hypothetical protein
MKDSSGVGGLPQSSRAVRAIAQDRHLRIRRYAETGQHTLQLRVLLVRLTGDASDSTGFPSSLLTCAATTSNVLPPSSRAVRTCPASIDTVIASDGDAGRYLARDTTSRSIPTPTRVIRRRIVS